jgi:preprotein translocase subunit SecA
LEDDLMRLFGSERLKSMMKTLKMPEDQPLEHRWITSSIESAQKRVEGHNFDIRKRVVEYDDVMNRHRATTYRQRQAILNQESRIMNHESGEGDDIRTMVQGYIFDELRLLANNYSTDLKTVIENVNNIFPVGSDLKKQLEETGAERWGEILVEEAKKQYETKEKEAGSQMVDGEEIGNFRQAERAVLLRVMDILWMEHIDAMMKMREAIGLQGYGQRDPLVEYKQQAYAMFQRLQSAMAFDVARLIFKVKIVSKADDNIQSPITNDQQGKDELEEKKKLALRGGESSSASNFAKATSDKKATEDARLKLQGGAEPRGDFSDEEKEIAESQSPITNDQSPATNSQSSITNHQTEVGDPPSREATGDLRAVRDPQEHKDKVGRNDPCPCGSGKKYKKCHGA